MHLGIMLMLVTVVVSTNVSATLMIGQNQMSAFAQREENTGNATSSRMHEQTQLNLEERKARNDLKTDDRNDKSLPPLSEVQSVSERNSRILDDEPVQAETHTSSPLDTDISNQVEVGSSGTNEVGSSNANEVGSTDSNSIAVRQNQDNPIEITATESDPQRNNRDDPAYQAVVGFGQTSVDVATGNFVDSLQDLALEHADDVLAESQNPSARILARVGFASTVNTLRGPIGASVELLHIASAVEPSPTCAPGDPHVLRLLRRKNQPTVTRTLQKVVSRIREFTL